MGKITKVNRQRVNWLDIAKGLGILAVILGHCHLPELVWNSIYSWHMPIFFVIAGYFYREQPFYTLIKGKSRALLIPYLYTCIVIALIEGAKSGMIHHSVWVAIRDWLLAGAYGSYFGVKIGLNFIGPIWFLPALFFALLLLHFSLKFKYSYACIFVLFFIGYYESRLFIGLPGSINQGMISLPYTYVGFIIKKYNLIPTLVNKHVFFPLLIIWSVGIMGGYGHIDINTIYFGKGIGDFLFTIIAVLVFFNFSFIFQDVKIVEKILSFIGRNSLKILCFHNVECISFPFIQLFSGIPLLSHTRFIFPLRALYAVSGTIVMNFSQNIIFNYISIQLKH